MNRKKITFGLLGAGLASYAAYILLKRNIPGKAIPELPTVGHVDVERYMGDWYDIAHYPVRFQRGCTDSMAHYSLLPTGEVKVVNTCIKNGRPKKVEGKAWIVDKETNAKLKVEFYWPFAADYWILALADDYSWAVVGEHCRRYLWILSRTPQIPHDMGVIIEKIIEHGYDPDYLLWEKHSLQATDRRQQ